LPNDFDISIENDFTHCQLWTLTLEVTPVVTIDHCNAILIPVLESISPTFKDQLLHQYTFAKKLQSQAVIRENLAALSILV